LERAIIDQYDLVTWSPFEGKDVFHRAKIFQALLIYFDIEFFHQLAANGFRAWFAKFDSTA
jgi:hypothetical protein